MPIWTQRRPALRRQPVLFPSTTDANDTPVFNDAPSVSNAAPSFYVAPSAINQVLGRHLTDPFWLILGDLGTGIGELNTGAASGGSGSGSGSSGAWNGYPDRGCQLWAWSSISTGTLVLLTRQAGL